MEKFQDKQVKARLIAKVNYSRLNDSHEKVRKADYHLGSYCVEEVLNTDDFYEKHILKIISRMDSFQQNGSRLIFNAISHIHIRMTTTSN